MKIFIKHLLIFLLIGFLLFIFNFFNIICPFRYLFHIPCPACGFTRALLSLLKLDFRSYFYYNAMALPLSLAIILEFHAKFFNNKISKFINLFLISTIFMLIIYYLIKLY